MGNKITNFFRGRTRSKIRVHLCIKYQTTCYLDETILRLYAREQREKKRTS